MADMSHYLYLLSQIHFDREQSIASVSAIIAWFVLCFFPEAKFFLSNKMLFVTKKLYNLLCRIFSNRLLILDKSDIGL